MNGSLAMLRSLVADIASRLAKQGPRVEVALCPPYPLLTAVAAAIGEAGLSLGAQNVSAHPAGAFTGEVAASLLRELGCRWAIVGHSERRSLFGETSDGVALRARAAVEAGLSPIICVGESLEDRESGRTERAIGAQLEPVLPLLSRGAPGAVLAYEPVWAIGTGRSASPDQAGDVHAFIRSRLVAAGINATDVRILYGGSVKPDNAAALFSVDGIDGGLIGGASLDANDFVAICMAAGAASPN